MALFGTPQPPLTAVMVLLGEAQPPRAAVAALLAPLAANLRTALWPGSGHQRTEVTLTAVLVRRATLNKPLLRVIPAKAEIQ